MADDAKLPITRQIEKESRESGAPPADVHLQAVEDCCIYDRHGMSIPFKSLYQDRKSIIIFVRNFLCYSCKEYVDDLSKIPKEVLEGAEVSLVVIGQSAHHHIVTGYPHDIYVDPQRIIYQKLGMKREEKFTISAQASPHVKSGVFMGQLKSIWRAMTSPAFDFQGDLHQQGGAIIAGPGNVSLTSISVDQSTIHADSFAGSQVHFSHFDMNRLDHMPINWLLQLAGVQHIVNFSEKAKVIHV
ncbi:peroxiredoxin-like 2C isoform X2 [Dunckerocampus dactyliophorus]|uniref:peroxiredoxin-like 2C isoform X2 n=1 Tax=Dunckerocampus dactyliophorus TaxID=161453 RepID=UPI0024057D7F|nr:peroxiredoxin-like 2C isoform X2 [Dunckerocampus dactyliophorus]